MDTESTTYNVLKNFSKYHCVLFFAKRNKANKNKIKIIRDVKLAMFCPLHCKILNLLPPFYTEKVHWCLWKKAKFQPSALCGTESTRKVLVNHMSHFSITRPLWCLPEVKMCFSLLKTYKEKDKKSFEGNRKKSHNDLAWSALWTLFWMWTFKPHYFLGNSSHVVSAITLRNVDIFYSYGWSAETKWQMINIKPSSAKH